ncbi:MULTISPECIES: hypothetical protein [Dyella]|nr:MULTISPECIES: hypothetical protein [Dyella]
MAAKPAPYVWPKLLRARHASRKALLRRPPRQSAWPALPNGRKQLHSTRKTSNTNRTFAMRKMMRASLLLICVLLASGCADHGDVRPVCPALQLVPPDLMQEPTTEQRVRGELLEPPPHVTPRSADSKPS